MDPVALAEELLLLAYDDESGKATGSRIALDLGMAAGVLVDLALAGRIALYDGMVRVVDPTPIGEPIADHALAKIASDTPHTAASWVQRLRHGLRDRVLGRLVDRGVLFDVDETTQEFIHLHRYPMIDARVETDCRARLSEALTGRVLPDERTAALATLITAVRMEPSLGLSGDAAVAAHHRLEEIAGSAGFAGGDLEHSTVRPSVALVIAALTKAINAALGRPRLV